MTDIRGHKVDLDDARSVFVGRSVDASDSSTYIKLINAEGEETRLRISEEARAALVALLLNERHFTRDDAGQWRSA